MLCKQSFYKATLHPYFCLLLPGLFELVLLSYDGFFNAVEFTVPSNITVSYDLLAETPVVKTAHPAENASQLPNQTGHLRGRLLISPL